MLFYLRNDCNCHKINYVYHCVDDNVLFSIEYIKLLNTFQEYTQHFYFNYYKNRKYRVIFFSEHYFLNRKLNLFLPQYFPFCHTEFETTFIYPLSIYNSMESNNIELYITDNSISIQPYEELKDFNKYIRYGVYSLFELSEEEISKIEEKVIDSYPNKKLSEIMNYIFSIIKELEINIDRMSLIQVYIYLIIE